MELRDIEYFAAVAEHGNVRRASEALDLSPPALSKSLRRLEKSLQARVVKRTPKGVELTAVGAALLAQVRKIRVTLDDVAREAADLARGETGGLRIGSGSIVSEGLPQALIALLTESPKVKLRIVISDNDFTLPLLLKGELDLVFNYLDFMPGGPYDGISQELVYTDTSVVWAAVGHRLAKARRVRLHELVNERWVLTEPQVLIAQRLAQAFVDRRLPAPIASLETRSSALRIATVAGSDLLAYAPRGIFQQAAHRYGVKEIPVKELQWRRPVGVIYRKDAYLSPVAKRFIEVLKKTAKEVAA